MSAPEAPWHALDDGRVASLLNADRERGLAQSEAARRPAAQRLAETPLWRIGLSLFGSQWKGSAILILCAAAAVFWVLGHRNDSIGIVVSVAFAVVLGFLTDFRSQRALAALRALNAPSASVIRDGVMIEIAAGRLVAGDLVLLRGGAVVPADGRLISVSELTVDESALTGESAAVTKAAGVVSTEAVLAQRRNMVYAGTTAVTGSGRFLATAVGLDTELGRIGRLVQGYKKEETPLEVQVEALGRRLGVLILVLCALATALGLLLGQAPWEMLETGFLLAIAAIPEGLPAVNTVALAGGVRRMVRERSIVRRLAAVEVLGSVDVVCTDKTGTLTENVMRVSAVCLPARRLDVSGSGYVPEARFTEGTEQVQPARLPDLQVLLRIAALCNDAALEAHDHWHIHGSPTEGALLTLAAEGGLDWEAARKQAPRRRAVPFTSSRKRMTVVVQERGAAGAYAKGAVGALLPLCERLLAGETERPLGDAARREISLEAERLGAQGLRVLGLAYKAMRSVSDEPEAGLVWAGMVGLLDPPRRNAAQAVAALKGAGVRTIMVTGDQKGTAAAIAARLGLPAADGAVRDAQELADMIKRRAWDELESVAVFARVSPEDKLRLVEALKERGHVVAMTGDGINDAPALKAADIGVAMGVGAADVAKEAADLVITDAEYATLTTAVEEGRRIYANLQRSVRYLLLCSFANIGLMMASIALRLPLAMTALQLLWLNLVIHIFPAMGLAVAPNPRDVMREPPRSRKSRLLGWPEIRSLALRSVVIWAAALAIYRASLESGLAAARTLAMCALGVSLLAQTFPILAGGRGLATAVRHASRAMWLSLAAGLTILALMLYLPRLNALLETVALTPGQWRLPLAAAAACLAAVSWLDNARIL